MGGDGERSSARQNNLVVSVEVVNAGGPQNQKFFGAVMVEVVAQGRNGAVGETVAVVESGGSGGAELGAALETNGVELGGEKIVEVGATAEKDVVGAEEGVTAVGQMQGDRLYCHQCRQMRNVAFVACKGGLKKKGKCALKYCERCVRNRYPEVAEEALRERAWKCPNCKNDCNCSICKRNKGEVPTGPVVRPGRKRKGSANDTPTNKKPLLGAVNTDALEDDIEIPQGTLVTRVAGIEMPSEDVGAAIQFLEFFRLFGKIFNIREGQPVQTLKEITEGRQLREVPSVVAELHINLLSIIEKGKAKSCEYPRHGDEWIRKAGEYIVDLTVDTKDLILHCLNQGVSGYKNLSPSCKLDVLNCLCDEALSSEREQIKSKINAARNMVRELKKRREVLEGGETASNEIEDITSNIKKANAEKKAAMNELKKLGRVLKITPVSVDKGVAYWKLYDYCNNNTNIMRQEFADENTLKNKDKWFMFPQDQQKVIEDKLSKR